MTQSAGKSLQLLWSFEGIAFAPYPSTTDFPTPQNIFSHFELIPVYFCLIFFFENLKFDLKHLVDLLSCFKVLKKCMNKFDCLVNEMLYIKQLTPSLNVQTDSIRAKVFV